MSSSFARLRRIVHQNVVASKLFDGVLDQMLAVILGCTITQNCICKLLRLHQPYAQVSRACACAEKGYLRLPGNGDYNGGAMPKSASVMSRAADKGRPLAMVWPGLLRSCRAVAISHGHGSANRRSVAVYSPVRTLPLAGRSPPLTARASRAAFWSRLYIAAAFIPAACLDWPHCPDSQD
jgi:hypothetical protein